MFCCNVVIITVALVILFLWKFCVFGVVVSVLLKKNMIITLPDIFKLESDHNMRLYLTDNSTLSLPHPFFISAVTHSLLLTSRSPLRGLTVPRARNLIRSRYCTAHLTEAPDPATSTGPPRPPGLEITPLRYSAVARVSLRGFFFFAQSWWLSNTCLFFAFHIAKMVSSKNCVCTKRHRVSRRYFLPWPLLWMNDEECHGSFSTKHWDLLSKKCEEDVSVYACDAYSVCVALCICAHTCMHMHTSINKPPSVPPTQLDCDGMSRHNPHSPENSLTHTESYTYAHSLYISDIENIL